MSTVLIRGGPWGFILQDETASSRCLFRLMGLAELPDLVRGHNAHTHQVTGRPPRAFAQWVLDHAADFRRTAS